MTSILRRVFALVLALVLSPWIGTPALGAGPWEVWETSFTSGRKYRNPFVDVQVDVVFRGGGQQLSLIHI